MRIISKFKDYYDGGQSYGIDTATVYVRNSSIDKIHDLPDLKGSPFYPYTNDKRYSSRYDNKLHIKNYIDLIGFCGKIYPILRVFSVGDLSAESPYIPNQIENAKLLSTFEDVENQQYCTQVKNMDSFSVISRKHDSVFFKSNIIDVIKSKEKYFYNLFLRYKVPIFYITQNTIILNPSLKDFAFYRLINTQQAFQEISMFISNNLSSDIEVEIPVGSDIELRDSKGFNNWSFKKEPGQQVKRKKHRK